MLELNKTLPFLIDFPSIQRTIIKAHLYIAENVILNLYVKNTLDEKILEEGWKYRLETGNPDVKVDSITGKFVYKFKSPIDSIIKYTSWNTFVPFDIDGYQLNWIFNSNGEEEINPEFDSAITEEEFYKYLLTQPISVKTLIENTIDSYIANDRFKYKQY